MSIWFKILAILVTVVIAFIVGVTYMGIRRKIIARTQNRVGPPIWQNFYDIIKLYVKESNIHHGVMHHMGPSWFVAMAITAVLFIPVVYGSDFFANFNFNGDLILILYLLTFGPLGMALGAGQTGNPNSAIGVTRGLSLMVGYEIPWLFAIIALMVQYHTTSVTDMVRIQQESGTWFMFSNPWAFIAALMTLPGMFHYSPFDIIGAPAELASGPMSENGGKYLGIFMSAGSVLAFVKLTLFVDIFMGGATNLVELVVKTFAVYMYPVLWSIVSVRFRTEQAIRYFWGWPLFFGVLALIVAFV